MNEFTDEELLHIHLALTIVKNQNTAEGQVWILHGLNARIRTKIEHLIGATHE